MRRKYTRDLACVDIAVSGIPFDQATSHRPGTRFGPEAIRKASAENAWGPFWPWMFDPFDTLAVIDYGDCFFDWGRKETAPGFIEKHAAEIIASGAEMLTFGGDHYVTYPLLKAHAKKHGPLALVHFDAHRDVEPDDGGRIDHGTMFNYAVKDGVIDPKKSIQDRHPYDLHRRAQDGFYDPLCRSRSCDDSRRGSARDHPGDGRNEGLSHLRYRLVSTLRRLRAPARRSPAASPTIRPRQSSASLYR